MSTRDGAKTASESGRSENEGDATAARKDDEEGDRRRSGSLCEALLAALSRNCNQSVIIDLRVETG
jgi:hypothetical protein